jgi:hypothetical protein
MSQKIIALNVWKDIYRRSVHKKVHLKYFILWEIQKRKISDKKIYYLTTILILFTIRIYLFYIFQNTTYLLTRLFAYTSYVYIYLCILTP